MGILDDFKELWVREGMPNKSIGMPKVSKGNKVMYGVVPSSDNEKIETILNSIIGRICIIDRDSDGVSNLKFFLNDIVNREECIYPLIMDVCNWQYEECTNDNFKFYQFRLVSNNKRYIVIDVRLSLDDDILEFTSMYYSDVSNYLVGKRDSNFGTIFLKVSSLDGVNYSLEDKIYGLDLLNNSYDSLVINNSLLSEYQGSVGVKKVRLK